MYTYTQNRILHHEDCPARSLYPWKRSKTRLLFKKFSQLLTIKGMALRMNNKVLSCDPDVNSVLLTNQIVFLDMFWSFDGIIINILYFREFIISSSSWRRQAFPLEVVKKVGGEQERGIRSKKFAKQAKAWTTEIVWIFVYTHTGYKRITHGFRFTYIKEYPHPRGICCNTSWIAMLRF